MAANNPEYQEPIPSREALIRYFEAGNKPRSAWRIGTEHEKFGFHQTDLTPIPYEGPAGIHAIFKGMAATFHWEMILENGLPIALTKGAGSITLEPGGQVELSGEPLTTIHATQEEINEHLRQLAAICRTMNIAFVGIGTQPKWSFDQIPWMPKGRYKEMRRYLPTKGRLSLDMMTRTATVQANLDYSDEGDMVRKFRLAMALQPLATALFANSPFIDGRPSGYLSYRAEIWRHTDPDRCGWLPMVFKDGFGFEPYLDYALATPLLFRYQDGRYRDAGGIPFQEFMGGRHPFWPGERATMADWTTHLTTLFPDVRLKQYLELRGADAGNSARLCALPALWKGLLYDDQAMQAAWELVKDWSLEERDRIHGEVPRLALQTLLPDGRRMQNLALEVLDIAEDGLNRQNQRNAAGCLESVYLHPLFEVAESGHCPADLLLEAYYKRWHESVDPLFREQEVDSFYAICD